MNRFVSKQQNSRINILFGWLVANGWYWFLLSADWLLVTGFSERKVLLAGG
jgi:hypothetical protein